MRQCKYKINKIRGEKLNNFRRTTINISLSLILIAILSTIFDVWNKKKLYLSGRVLMNFTSFPWFISQYLVLMVLFVSSILLAIGQLYLMNMGGFLWAFRLPPPRKKDRH